METSIACKLGQETTCDLLCGFAQLGLPEVNMAKEGLQSPSLYNVSPLPIRTALWGPFGAPKATARKESGLLANSRSPVQ